MTQGNALKITLIGSGSITFCPPTLIDIYLSDRLNQVPLEICLMDISEDALLVSEHFAQEAAKGLNRKPKISTTTQLEEALKDANFVVTAIEVERNYFWSQDFHIPRKYGFRQVYGENGGPGGMFHTLRNLGPMLEIAKAMERVCPDAWLINYTNPEAKLVEGISRLTDVKVVGLCHGAQMGVKQLSEFLNISSNDLEVTACGLNHFGWFQKISRKSTGEDLYPFLRDNEKRANWLSDWDEIALSRILMRTFGLYPYPGTNHIGEYIAWSDEFLGSSKLQYFYDPVNEHPWNSRSVPPFVYSLSQDPTSIPLFTETKRGDSLEDHFDINSLSLTPSGELGVPIMEAITFDIRTNLLAVNMQNKGTIPGLSEHMVVEFSAYADGGGIHPIPMDPLPDAITEMIRIQGTIHQLVIDAFVEESKNKLLQALLIDPTVSTYKNAVHLVNEMSELQREYLPTLTWGN